MISEVLLLISISSYDFSQEPGAGRHMFPPNPMDAKSNSRRSIVLEVAL
jgi:hypothetical protein